ncbi:MAG: hypothetical protein IJS61_00505 [Firmicutes bacterium]|nr:hypothetical protein [Bacillota bacterium]
MEEKENIYDLCDEDDVVVVNNEGEEPEVSEVNDNFSEKVEDNLDTVSQDECDAEPEEKDTKESGAEESQAENKQKTTAENNCSPDVSGEITTIKSEISKIRVMLSSLVSATNARDAIERTLTDENQKYKNDFYTEIVSPYLIQFASLHKELSKDVASLERDLENCEDENIKSYLKEQYDTVKYYKGNVEGILLNFGVVIEYPCEGESFNEKKMSIAKTLPLGEGTTFGTVAEVKSGTYI